jgi:hypothetical protein
MKKILSGKIFIMFFRKVGSGKYVVCTYIDRLVCEEREKSFSTTRVSIFISDSPFVPAEYQLWLFRMTMHSFHFFSFRPTMEQVMRTAERGYKVQMTTISATAIGASFHEKNLGGEN